jgi:hypothetical protein
MIRELIRDEIRRLIRADALAPDAEVSEEELDLRRRAHEAASKFRRARG